jgi:hypothetical protein
MIPSEFLVIWCVHVSYRFDYRRFLARPVNQKRPKMWWWVRGLLCAFFLIDLFCLLLLFVWEILNKYTEERGVCS